jgi:peptide/nickel transport system substrate-binding protein
VATLFALAGCDLAPVDNGALVVSAIGAPPRLAPAGDTPARLLTDATAEGLVRFDAAGQVEPGLAERWIVIDGGRSYIFRLREATWSDGRPIDAPQIARMLARQAGPRSRNPLAPFLTAVDSIVAMTPQVIELRLARPRPDLLKLFAQPELALVRRDPVAGSGPLRVVSGGRTPLLRPMPDPMQRADGERETSDADVRFIGERAAKAVARFVAGEADVVAGGSFADWPLVEAAGPRRREVRIDPAVGLFGLAIVNRDGFLADPANRTAVNQAMDRAGITAAVSATWEATDRLLPDGLDSAAPPHVADWTLLTLAERRIAARARIAAWPGGPVGLRVALPAGPGATRLWGAIAGSLSAVGITATRVGMREPADLRLVDAVAPYDNARWYLATACRPCGAVAAERLDAARTAATLGERALRTAEADAALDADVAFIPIARPFRWSLVSRRATGWQPNARAWHPLNRLRLDPN